MQKIRILIVDDSVVIRKLLTDALAADPLLEIAGIAANGRIALSKIPQVNPDLVTLDIEMPEMNGLEALAELRKTYPRLPVIMFSTVTERGAAATLDALALGANDYVTKPANVGGLDTALKRVREDLIPKIKTLCSPAAALSMLSSPRPPRPSLAPLPKPAEGARAARIDVLAIGVSTGGPNALAELLPQLPRDFPAPIVIVQHMPPIFTRFLADRLAARCQIGVVEASMGLELKPGQAAVAPGDFHMAVEKQGRGLRVVTQQGPPENSCRPAVDVLFRSVAETFGPHSLAVIMTGMGQDGLRGCERIREAGGQILAQDEATSVVWGMPGFVVNAGLADKVLPLGKLAAEIVQRASQFRAGAAVEASTPYSRVG
ncbi:MAG TPA: chemotaxis response regulator protein-glutamate methylesterase [Terriglobia bacterium]|nr:chemotaxis response regulator protein-glutamate methylesterase [Terriglobia bacterium]